MTLYFYFLDGCEVSMDSCEVIELPKTYKPVDRFPKGYYNCFVKKSDIGRVINLCKNVVILLEKNDAEACRIFINHLSNDLEDIKDSIRSLLDRELEIKNKISSLEQL